ncbi:HhH-GPD [Rubrobacter xylanophilus DSM 9941]|uniref:HhH-GPD n=2 Tax=Rubrobacter xylanophilus TaxID=49319 RepID=Q1ATW0_RUBXD|nr:HhH-GPD [Rubrobacter xylanophilus DSM 9941]
MSPATCMRPEDRSRIAASLAALGIERGYSYPWHRAEEPFRVLLAEYLLRRTTRKVVARVYERVLSRYPSAAALATARDEDLWAVAREAGLRRRTLQLIEIARQIVQQGGVQPSRERLLDLPFVGPYIADAVLLYSFNERVFPLDNNVQRVLYRVMQGTHPPKSMDPYRDKALEQIADVLTKNLDAVRLRHLHQGILVVAWEVCRAAPICRACTLRTLCLYSTQSDVPASLR